MNIIVIYKDLPPRAKAFTRANADGSYTIIINARHCWETQKAAYLEELKHIRGNDFDLDLQVNLIEEMRHRELMSSQKEKKESNNSINFNEWSG